MVNENYLLLDNQSTVNQIANPSMLKNIRKSSKPIKIHCNAGMSKTDLEGELGGMTVYHNPNGIANVLSLKLVADKTGSRTTAGIGTEFSRYITRMGWWSSSQASVDFTMLTCQ